MTRRKPISRKVRFEVFKRDRFACVYCGRKAPEVLLEVDHVVAVANGGTNELTNLVSACSDCNRGKAARLLEESSTPVVTKEATDALSERIEQARAYAEAVKAERDLADSTVWMVWDAWAQAFGADRTESGWTMRDRQIFPEEASVRTFLKRLPVSDVLEAVDRTAARMRKADWQACKYFYGTCWRKIKGE